MKLHEARELLEESLVEGLLTDIRKKFVKTRAEVDAEEASKKLKDARLKKPPVMEEVELDAAKNTNESQDQTLVKRQGSYWDNVAKEKKDKEKAAAKAKQTEHEKTAVGKAEKYWSNKTTEEAKKKAKEIKESSRLVERSPDQDNAAERLAMKRARDDMHRRAGVDPSHGLSQSDLEDIIAKREWEKKKAKQIKESLAGQGRAAEHDFAQQSHLSNSASSGAHKGMDLHKAAEHNKQMRQSGGVKPGHVVMVKGKMGMAFHKHDSHEAAAAHATQVRSTLAKHDPSAKVTHYSFNESGEKTTHS